MREGLRRALGRDDLDRGDLLAQQPAGRVHLVDHRVGHRHEAGVGLAHGRVAVDVVDDQGVADGPALERRLDLPVAGVVAAHVADDDEALSERRLGREDLLALGDRGGERLLAHDRLAGGDAGEHVLGVRGADGRDEDRVDLVAVDQVEAVVEDGGAVELVRDLLRTGAVDVRDRAHRGAVDDVDELATVVLADEAGADDADPDGHGCKSFLVVSRLGCGFGGGLRVSRAAGRRSGRSP